MRIAVAIATFSCIVFGAIGQQQPILVKDINTSPAGIRQTFDYSPVFTKSGNLAFFSVEDDYGLELWRTDGTSSGTFRVIDLYPGQGDGVSPNLNSTVS